MRPAGVARLLLLTLCLLIPTLSANAQAGGGLVGNWRLGSAIVRIRADGVISSGGDALRYTADGSVTNLIFDDGTLPIQY